MRYPIIYIVLLLLSSNMYAQGTLELKDPNTTGGNKVATGKTIQVRVDPYAGVEASPSTNQNYIHTRTYTSENGENGGSYLDQFQYYDGLGRPVQTVQRGITPNANDLVTYQEYDPFGRESNSWLPVVIQSNNGAYADLSKIKSNINATYPGETTPYATTEYEPSPLNRVLKQYGPGQAWRQPTDLRAVETAYLANKGASGELSCMLFKVSGSGLNTTLTHSGCYADGELYVTQITDEDHNRSYQLKDKLGQLILTRQIAKVNGKDENYDTYYAYDDFGNLSYVLPPMLADKVQAKTLIPDADLLLLGYTYKYDARNRCIRKTLPGCEPILYVYDKADRLIFTQDGEQRLKGEWLFTFYDAFGRMTITGKCTEANGKPITIGCFDKNLIKSEYIGSGNNSGKMHGYALTIDNLPLHLKEGSLYAANYYDNYRFRSLPGLSDVKFDYDPQTGYNSRYGDDKPENAYKSKGLLTGTIMRQLDVTDKLFPLYSVMYYDQKKQLIQTKSNNHFAGLEKECIAYNFTGQPTKKMHAHTVGSRTQTEHYTYEYDHAGRLLKTTHKLNDGTETLLAEHKYDELGRLNSLNKANLPALKTTYDYTIRSWTKSIKSPRFIEILDYTPGGNISEMYWNHEGSAGKYTFTYDNLSRLLTATHHANQVNTSYTYDKHGNTTHLTRVGIVAPRSYMTMDDLTMRHYGNQLISAGDTGNKVSFAESADFKDYTPETATTEYRYNGNGAMYQDLNKGISRISYNNLNLPLQMDIKSPVAEARNNYIYTASGAKLQVKTQWNPDHSTTPVIGDTIDLSKLSKSKVTDYLGNKIYENKSLKKILIDGGYYDVTDNKYYFYLTDHLGNNRVVANQSGIVVQQTNYYPFGMVMAGTITGGMGSTDPGRQPFKYNGKELDSDHGFNTYDYSARYYDPAITRFTSVDPLAEKYYSISPYVYCANNPILFIDPDGRQTDLPEWMKQYASGAWGAAAGMAVGIVKSNPVSMVSQGVGEAGKVIDAYQEGGAGAAVSQYGSSVYETSGAKGIAQTVEGVAKGDPKAIGAAVTMAATVVVAKGATKSAGAPAAENGAIVMSGEQILSKAIKNGPERIGNYEINGAKGMVGDTFTRNIFSISADKGTKGLSNFRGMVNTMEKEAISAGANKLSIQGNTVQNAGFLNPNTANRFGYSFQNLGEHGVLFQKTLKP